MSEWYEAKDEEIEIDLKCREFNIFVTNNDFGNVYVTLTFAQVKKIAGEIPDEKP